MLYLLNYIQSKKKKEKKKWEMFLDSISVCSILFQNYVTQLLLKIYSKA